MTTNLSKTINQPDTKYIKMYLPMLTYQYANASNEYIFKAECLRLWNKIMDNFKPSLVMFIMFLATTELSTSINMKDSNYRGLINFLQKQSEKGKYKINYPSKVSEDFNNGLNELIKDMKAFEVEYKDYMITMKLWNYYGFREINILMNRHKLNTMTELKNKFSCDELLEIIKKHEHTQILMPEFDNYDF